MNKFDFSGYATKNDLLCSDGRIIKANAFKEDDGETVPLVWQHVHNDPMNVLGHAVLENRKDGVYAYCSFNNTDGALNAKELVKHGDVDSLSIYANDLIQNGSNVTHGRIREVSLVLSGANPGALIDNLSFAHGDEYEPVDDEAIIYTGLELSHANEGSESEKDNSMNKEKPTQGDGESENTGKTIQDVLDEMTEEQKKVLYYLVEQAANGETEEEDEAEEEDETEEHGEKPKENEKDKNKEMEQSSIGEKMTRNVFDNSGVKNTLSLSHAQFTEIMDDAKRIGSLRDSFLEHSQQYGIENIDVLFPDAKTPTPTPEILSRQMEWVPLVLNQTHHSPFSRVKTVAADVTDDKARAKGYQKGSLKREEMFKLLHRVTTPTTIYKKQKLDRDDILDITDFDVVSFMKSEMRMMLDEEIARAVLIGDGREIGNEDKINDENVRPIWTDDDLYSIKVPVANNADPAKVEEAILRARKDYRGTGVPVMFVSPDTMSDLLLQKDTRGIRLYKTEGELAAALRVAAVIEVPEFEGATRARKSDQTKLELIGIVVNLADYTIGADRGGEVSMFDDFDIDYNQNKYLIETRISGALTVPKSALVIEREPASN